MNQFTMSAYWPLLKWNSPRSTGASTDTTCRSMKLIVVSPSSSAIRTNSAPRVKTGSNFGAAPADTGFPSRGLKLDMGSQYHQSRREPRREARKSPIPPRSQVLTFSPCFLCAYLCVLCVSALNLISQIPALPELGNRPPPAPHSSPVRPRAAASPPAPPAPPARPVPLPGSPSTACAPRAALGRSAPDGPSTPCSPPESPTSVPPTPPCASGR